ncbi:retrovirus-related pol polyprotein from transposon TNT 1-94 [Tanacetum coccineum]
MRALLIQHRCEAALEVTRFGSLEKLQWRRLCAGRIGQSLRTLYHDQRERTDRRIARPSRGKARSKSRGGRLKCYIFQFEDHLKRNCSKNNRKKSTGYVKKDDQLSSVVRFMMILSILLGDNMECKIRGLGKVYSLRFKHKAFGKFKKWKQLVENQTRRTVKKLRTDNGLEFCNWEFEQLCVESGIARHLTVFGMPSPSTTIEKKTPMEMWSGHPSDYRMLRIFSYVAYSHVKQDKLEPRALKCVLLGYLEDTLKDSGAGADKSVEELQVEEIKKLIRHRISQIISWFGIASNLKDKNETCSFEMGNMVAYVSLLQEEEEDTHEPLTYQEAVACEDNDMLIACKSKAEIGSTKSLLKKEFDMNELGEANKILGMEIARDRSRKILRVSQSGYLSKILNNFRIDDGKSVQMPLGGHFKLSLKDYPVRDCDVERMSKVPYENAVRSLMTNRSNHVGVTGFVDSEYGKDPDKEAGCMALTKAVKEAIWLRGLLEELSVKLNNVAVIVDNQGEITYLE